MITYYQLVAYNVPLVGELCAQLCSLCKWNGVLWAKGVSYFFGA